MDRTDVALIGAGPIGIEMAVALRRAGIDYRHFDARQIGHTISWFAPQTRFFSSSERIAIAGIPLQVPDQGKATREQYLAYLRSVVRAFDLKIRTYEPVRHIAHRDGGFVLTTRPAGGSDRLTLAGKLILCTGGTDHPRRLGIPGESLPHVSPYFNDPHTYFNRRLLIVGGKNSAAEAALRCHNAGAEVAISYRREKLPEKSIKYWLLPELEALIRSGQIQAHFRTQPVAITPTHVRLKRGDTEFDVPADFVLLLIGYQQDNSLLRLAGVELVGDALAPSFDPATMQTNVPGIFVAGTVTGGTQTGYTVFIENCHVHVHRIIAQLTGKPADSTTPSSVFELPES